MLLGKIIELPNPSPRTNRCTIVPFRVVEYKGDQFYECVIVRGNTLSGAGIGTHLTMSLDFHSSIEGQGMKIVELS